LKTERGGEIPAEAPLPTPPGAGRRIAARFAACTALLLASGIGLIVLCDALVERRLQVGAVSFVLGESVVGSIGVALVTSLPELVVCLAAVKLGAFDMALGNIFGSNIFNMVLLPLAHFVRPGRAFWSEALPAHGLVLVGAMALTCIIATGIRRRSEAAVLRMGWDGVLVTIIGAGILVIVAAMGVTF